MITFPLAIVMTLTFFMLGVAVLVFGFMIYDAITTPPFVSHKGKKWAEIAKQLPA